MSKVPSDEAGSISTLVAPTGKKIARRGAAGLFVARCPGPGAAGLADRIRVAERVTVGRGDTADLVIDDARVSQAHFAVERAGRGWAVEDLGSTNGTFVDGERLGGRAELPEQAVIRAGESVLVFHARAAELLSAILPEDRPPGWAGSFHLADLHKRVQEAALSGRGILLTGPSGVGKELAAQALANLWRMQEPLAHNAARTAGEQEASRVLFGVADKAFTGVAAHEGLVAAASRARRPLFIDEVHHLPASVQGVLLRVMEERRVQRIGEEERAAPVDVRFVLASNAPERLTHDLRARMRELRIPPLRERVADVPAIFDALLGAEAARQAAALAALGVAVADVHRAVDGDCYEDLCLAAARGAFDESNIRGLVDIVDRLTTRIAAGAEPAAAVDSIFGERFLPAEAEEVSHYERQRELITAVFIGCGHNVSRTVDLLKESGVPWRCSRRHLTDYLARWGLK